jgi:hypothetical protein
MVAGLVRELERVDLLPVDWSPESELELLWSLTGEIREPLPFRVGPPEAHHKKPKPTKMAKITRKSRKGPEDIYKIIYY